MMQTRGDEAVLRPAGGADAAEIAELYLAARREALPYLREVHRDDEVRRWIAEVLIARGGVWVAQLEGEIVGMLALLGEELDQLYVRPDRYRQGIGDRLLAKAKELNPRRLRLFTFQRNGRARAFYEARGFVPIVFSDGSRNEEREPDVLYRWTAAG